METQGKIRQLELDYLVSRLTIAEQSGGFMHHDHVIEVFKALQSANIKCTPIVEMTDTHVADVLLIINNRYDYINTSGVIRFEYNHDIWKLTPQSSGKL